MDEFNACNAQKVQNPNSHKEKPSSNKRKRCHGHGAPKGLTMVVAGWVARPFYLPTSS